MSNPIVRRLPLLIIILLLTALVVYLQWPEAKVAKPKRERVIPVKTVVAAQAEFKDVIEALGTTRANEQVLITSKYADIVDDISFQDGQVVKKGDILVTLNGQEEAAKVRELEANLAESVAQLNRLQDLYRRKATSISLVEEQEAQAKAISAQLLSAKTRLQELTITAPFDGVLGFRQISVGAYINAGNVITSLDDLSVIKVDFSVPERFLPTILPGQTVVAESTAYQGKSFSGKITSVDSRIDNVTRTLRVRAEIANPDYLLRAGMLLNVRVERQVDNVLLLPESAIIPIEDKHYVFTVEGDKAVRKTISIGRRQLGVIEVVDGLKVGEQVVIEGALKLRPNTSVKILGADS